MSKELRSVASIEAVQRRVAVQVEICPFEALPDLVVGVDAAYEKSSGQASGLAIGAATVVDTATFEVVESVTVSKVVTVDYRPGFLALREAPVVLAAIEQLSQVPELIICDGHGVAHPSRAGLACHIGVALGVPTIGCAKNRLTGTHAEVGPLRGDHELLVDSGEPLGAALRTQTNVKCVYISPGHLTDTTTSVNHILALAPRYRQPETTRAADRACRVELSNRIASKEQLNT